MFPLLKMYPNRREFQLYLAPGSVLPGGVGRYGHTGMFVCGQWDPGAPLYRFIRLCGNANHLKGHIVQCFPCSKCTQIYLDFSSIGLRVQCCPEVWGGMGIRWRLVLDGILYMFIDFKVIRIVKES